VTRRARIELVLTLALALFLCGQTLYRSGLFGKESAHTDLHAFLAGARALVHGERPFGVVDDRDLPYVYPPAIALVFVPFLPLGNAGAALVFFLLSIGVFASGVIALRRALGTDDPVPLLLVLLPFASAVERSQMGPLLAGLVSLGAAALVAKRPTRGGGSIAGAVALKATPILALVTLVRRPRALAGATIVLVLLLLVGPALFLGLKGALAANMDFAQGMGVRYAKDPASQGLAEGTTNYRVYELSTNQSLLATLHRTRIGPTTAFRPLAYALAILIILGASVPALLLPRDADARRVVATVGLAAASSLLFSPVAWHHHHVLLYPALAAIGRSRWLVPVAILELLHFAVPSLRPYGLLTLATLTVLAVAFSVSIGSSHEPQTDPSLRKS